MFPLQNGNYYLHLVECIYQCWLRYRDEALPSEVMTEDGLRNLINLFISHLQLIQLHSVIQPTGGFPWRDAGFTKADVLSLVALRR